MKTNALYLSALAGLVAAQSNGTSLTDVLSANNDTLSTLSSLLETQPDLVETLSQASNITILAPSNDALASVLNSTDTASLGSTITALLSYHVLNGTFTAEDIMASNSSLFVPTMLDNSTYENITGAQVVEVSHENDTVSIYTWLRHQANVTQADIEFDGGVIHVINSLLQIPQNVTDTAVQAGLSAAAGAITEAGLSSDLVGLSDVTVFVPNNPAFANIASVTANLSAEDLGNILSYHVVEGTVAYSTDLMNGTIESMQGSELRILVQDGNVYVNDAQVVVADVLIANGVLHVIDDVLNPDNVPEEVNPSATTPSFPDATGNDDEVPYTSGIPTPSAEPTGLEGIDEDDESAAPRSAAAIAMGAMLGGAVLIANLV